MNFETFGKNLVDVLAQRSLEVLRGTSLDDVKRVMHGQLPPSLTSEPRSGLGTAGAVIGAFAVGAAIGVGVTALYTPTTGDELRKLLTRGTKDVRKQALSFGGDVRGRLDDARSTLAHGVEQFGTAVGIASPAPKRTRKRKTAALNGAGKTRSRKAAAARVQHDA